MQLPSLDADGSSMAAAPRAVGGSWPIIVAASVAGMVAAYLGVTTLIAGAKPIGCGAGSGCAAVLSSRWSRVLGMPVGLPAAGLYAAVVVAATLAARSASPARRRQATACLWIAAGAISAAVGWFVALQAVDLGVFCPWCLIDHALGIGCVMAIFAQGARQQVFHPLAFLAGTAGSAALVGAQLFGPQPAAVIGTLDERQLATLEQGLAIEIAEVPHLGSADAPAQVAALFDYCCPHCRQLHAQLVDVLDASPERFVLALLPMPLNHECNPHETETEPRFADSCALARLALAVWRADRTRFAEFDRWLFESPQPRTAVEARTAAEALVGAEALATALADPWVEARLRADVEAYAASGIGHLPVLLAPGRGGVSGRVDDAAGVRAILTERLGVDLGSATPAGR